MKQSANRRKNPVQGITTFSQLAPKKDQSSTNLPTKTTNSQSKSINSNHLIAPEVTNNNSALRTLINAGNIQMTNSKFDVEESSSQSLLMQTGGAASSKNSRKSKPKHKRTNSSGDKPKSANEFLRQLKNGSVQQSNGQRQQAQQNYSSAAQKSYRNMFKSGSTTKNNDKGFSTTVTGQTAGAFKNSSAPSKRPIKGTDRTTLKKSKRKSKENVPVEDQHHLQERPLVTEHAVANKKLANPENSALLSSYQPDDSLNQAAAHYLYTSSQEKTTTKNISNMIDSQGMGLNEQEEGTDQYSSQVIIHVEAPSDFGGNLHLTRQESNELVGSSEEFFKPSADLDTNGPKKPSEDQITQKTTSMCNFTVRKQPQLGEALRIQINDMNENQQSHQGRNQVKSFGKSQEESDSGELTLRQTHNQNAAENQFLTKHSLLSQQEGGTCRNVKAPQAFTKNGSQSSNLGQNQAQNVKTPTSLVQSIASVFGALLPGNVPSQTTQNGSSCERRNENTSSLQQDVMGEWQQVQKTTSRDPFGYAPSDAKRAQISQDSLMGHSYNSPNLNLSKQQENGAKNYISVPVPLKPSQIQNHKTQANIGYQKKQNFSGFAQQGPYEYCGQGQGYHLNSENQIISQETDQEVSGKDKQNVAGILYGHNNPRHQASQPEYSNLYNLGATSRQSNFFEKKGSSAQNKIHPQQDDEYHLASYRTEYGPSGESRGRNPTLKSQVLSTPNGPFSSSYSKSPIKQRRFTQKVVQPSNKGDEIVESMKIQTIDLLSLSVDSPEKMAQSRYRYVMPGYNSKDASERGSEVCHGSVQRRYSDMNYQQPNPPQSKASRYSNVGAVIGSSPTERADIYSPEGNRLENNPQSNHCGLKNRSVARYPQNDDIDSDYCETRQQMAVNMVQSSGQQQISQDVCSCSGCMPSQNTLPERGHPFHQAQQMSQNNQQQPVSQSNQEGGCGGGRTRIDLETVLFEMSQVNSLVQTLRYNTEHMSLAHRKVLLDQIKALCEEWWASSSQFYQLHEIYEQDGNSNKLTTAAQVQGEKEQQEQEEQGGEVSTRIAGAIKESQALLCVTFGFIAALQIQMSQAQNASARNQEFMLKNIHHCHVFDLTTQLLNDAYIIQIKLAELILQKMDRAERSENEYAVKLDHEIQEFKEKLSQSQLQAFIGLSRSLQSNDTISSEEARDLLSFLNLQNEAQRHKISQFETIASNQRSSILNAPAQQLLGIFISQHPQLYQNLAQIAFNKPSNMKLAKDQVAAEVSEIQDPEQDEEEDTDQQEVIIQGTQNTTDHGKIYDNPVHQQDFLGQIQPYESEGSELNPFIDPNNLNSNQPLNHHQQLQLLMQHQMQSSQESSGEMMWSAPSPAVQHNQLKVGPTLQAITNRRQIMSTGQLSEIHEEPNNVMSTTRDGAASLGPTDHQSQSCLMMNVSQTQHNLAINQASQNSQKVVVTPNSVSKQVKNNVSQFGRIDDDENEEEKAMLQCDERLENEEKEERQCSNSDKVILGTDDGEVRMISTEKEEEGLVGTPAGEMILNEEAAATDFNQQSDSDLIQLDDVEIFDIAPLLPPANPKHKFYLFLDLDETLIHSHVQYKQEFQSKEEQIGYLEDLAGKMEQNLGRVPTKEEIDNEALEMVFNIRPYAEEFLEALSQHYELSIFTAGEQDYADEILNNLDLKGSISHRLYRQHTVQVRDPISGQPRHYIKDLQRVGRPLHRTIIIDNIRENFCRQPSNGITVTTWRDDPYDTELHQLMHLLLSLASRQPKDIRVALDECKASNQVPMHFVHDDCSPSASPLPAAKAERDQSGIGFEPQTSQNQNQSESNQMVSQNDFQITPQKVPKIVDQQNNTSSRAGNQSGWKQGLAHSSLMSPSSLDDGCAASLMSHQSNSALKQRSVANSSFQRRRLQEVLESSNNTSFANSQLVEKNGPNESSFDQNHQNNQSSNSNIDKLLVDGDGQFQKLRIVNPTTPEQIHQFIKRESLEGQGGGGASSSLPDIVVEEVADSPLRKQAARQRHYQQI